MEMHSSMDKIHLNVLKVLRMHYIQMALEIIADGGK
jgi:hypothetical protein